MPAILLVKTSSLGDVIHNLPVVTDLRQRFADLVIHWVVEEAFADIPRLHPGVNRVIPVAIRRWRKHLLSLKTLDEILGFRRELGKFRYDLVLDTQGLLKSGLMARYAHGHRVGFDEASVREPAACWFYDRKLPVTRQAHAVDRNRILAASALDYLIERVPDYGLDVAPAQAEWLPSTRYIVLLTATSRDDKLWPEEHWVHLANWLGAFDIRVVLPSGSARERERAQRIAEAVPGAVVAPPLRVSELAGVLAGALAAIGVDTGLTHLATAVGIPTLALFCASDPVKTGVLAGRKGQAINLGGPGKPPQLDAVAEALRELLGDALSLPAADETEDEDAEVPLPELGPEEDPEAAAAAAERAKPNSAKLRKSLRVDW